MPNLITVVRELPADLETPVSVYLKLAGHGPSFLLESINGGEQVARYSFIGVNPGRAYVCRDRVVERRVNGLMDTLVVPAGRDLLHVLDAELRQFQPEETHGLPRFTGGLVGYLGYDTIRFFEPTLKLSPHPALPDAIFLLADTLVAFDHAFGRLLLIANAHAGGDEDTARRDAERRLDDLQAAIEGPLPARQPARQPDCCTDLTSNMAREEYMAGVDAAKEYIYAGDIFQVVLSQRFSRHTGA
jgi:anthranilate synthase component I